MHIMMLSSSRSIHAQRWCRALEGRGNRVSLVGMEDELGYFLRASHVRGPGYRMTKAIRSRLGARRLARHIRKEKADLLHIHWLANWHLPTELDVPFVVSTWGSDVVSDPWMRYEGSINHAEKIAICRQADAVTASSKFLALQTATFAQLPPQKVEVIPFGVDLERFGLAGKSPASDAITIGFMKNLKQKYGPLVLIEAAKKICAEAPQTRFELAGTGEQADECRAAIEQYDLKENVHLIGKVPWSDVPERLAAWDIMAMPSTTDSETLGVAAIEAEAVGLPVVASAVGGVPEVVVDGKTGFLVPLGDAPALAEAILRLLHDPELRRIMGLAGRKHAEAHFDWNENVNQMEAVYQRLVS